MNDSVSSLIRHILTFGGGLLVAKGIISEAVSMDLVGAVMTLIGVIWGQHNASSTK